MVDGFENFNLPHSEASSKEIKGLVKRGRSSLPSTKTCTGNFSGGTSTRTDLNDTGAAVARTKSEPQPNFNNHNSSQDYEAREKESASVKSTLPQEPSVDICLDQLPDMSDCGIEFATIAPTPSEQLLNPQTFPPKHDHDNGTSGVTESQDAVSSDTLSCGHLRRPSLQSSSSIDSNNSPFPSPEINPIQVSEKSPGEYHPLADSKRPIRQRCRKCAKLKQESKTLKEELNKVQSEWKAEREQNTEQIEGLKEELYRQRLDNYELTQRVYGSEVRHREAMKTIQKLQMELQNMTQFFRLQQAEHAHLKAAYDCSLKAKCELFKVQLQRADSMQCPEEAYYGNAAGSMGHQGQYSVNNGPYHDHTSGYHEQIMTNTIDNFQAVHSSNHNIIHPHAM